jgi:hypothetical protein
MKVKQMKWTQIKIEFIFANTCLFQQKNLYLH